MFCNLLVWHMYMYACIHEFKFDAFYKLEWKQSILVTAERHFGSDSSNISGLPSQWGILAVFCLSLSLGCPPLGSELGAESPAAPISSALCPHFSQGNAHTAEGSSSLQWLWESLMFWGVKADKGRITRSFPQNKQSQTGPKSLGWRKGEASESAYMDGEGSERTRGGSFALLTRQVNHTAPLRAHLSTHCWRNGRVMWVPQPASIPPLTYSSSHVSQSISQVFPL